MESSAIKIKLESNDEEFEEKPKIENGLKEMENMDFAIASCSSNLMPSPSAFSKFVLRVLRFLCILKFLGYTQNILGVLK